MKTIKKMILSIMMMISFYGCEKEKPIAYSSSLIGEWEWFISCGGFAGCSTPQSSNTSMRLAFTLDSNYYRYINGTLESSSRFYTHKTVSQDNRDTTDIIQMGSLVEKYFIHRDTLELSAVTYNAGSAWKRFK
jgi:hypothetical protein